MCGILAYFGKNAGEKVLSGLAGLEYRGYDSSGIAILDDKLKTYKVLGGVDNLKELIKEKDINGDICIGHTRWATTGEPSLRNAHPHVSDDGRIVLVHNGNIENYIEIRNDYIKEGYAFHSDTDTSVLVELISDLLENNTLEQAVLLCLTKITGRYAFVFIDVVTRQLVAVKNGTPLYIGKTENEYVLCSDSNVLSQFSTEILHDDWNICVIGDNLTITDKNGNIKNKTYKVVEQQLIKSTNSGMLSEIYEQPTHLESLIKKGSQYKWGSDIKRIMILGCGSSYNAGLCGKYWIEGLGQIPVQVEHSSEFRYRNPILYDTDLVIFLSQSGETADTLASLEYVKSKGIRTLSITNWASTISNLSDCSIFMNVGAEVGVAATKTFTAQLVCLLSLVCDIDVWNVGDKIRTVLDKSEEIRNIALQFKDAEKFLFIGRGVNYPIALEGALKMKELSYVPAEGYPGGELKHGPLALIDNKTPVIALFGNALFDKMSTSVQEIKARGGKIISVGSDKRLADVSDHFIQMPETEECLEPILSVIPLQLLAYHSAVIRGNNVNRPRNLSKSVTTE